MSFKPNLEINIVLPIDSYVMGINVKILYEHQKMYVPRKLSQHSILFVKHFESRKQTCKAGKNITNKLVPGQSEQGLIGVFGMLLINQMNKQQLINLC